MAEGGVRKLESAWLKTEVRYTYTRQRLDKRFGDYVDVPAFGTASFTSDHVTELGQMDAVAEKNLEEARRFAAAYPGATFDVTLCKRWIIGYTEPAQRSGDGDVIYTRSIPEFDIDCPVSQRGIEKLEIGAIARLLQGVTEAFALSAPAEGEGAPNSSNASPQHTPVPAAKTEKK
jgi:hypothetical protein